MIKLLRCMLLLTFIVAFTTCKKDGPSTILPEATQEGKNTMGMKVNGEVWTPYYPCGAFLNPCGAMEFSYNKTNNLLYNINLGSSRNINGGKTTFGFYTVPNASISSSGNKYDSIYVTYTDYMVASGGWVDYSKSYNPKGKFIITKLDFAKEIISGTFEMTLYNNGDSVVITDGRFDCKFYTCVCN
jgi:hypothetical protein